MQAFLENKKNPLLNSMIFPRLKATRRSIAFNHIALKS